MFICFFFLVFFSVFFCSLLAVVFFSFASEQQSDLLCKSAPKFSHSIFGIFFYFILFLCNICFYDAHFVSSKILPHVCTSVCVLSAYFIFHGEYPYWKNVLTNTLSNQRSFTAFPLYRNIILVIQIKSNVIKHSLTNCILHFF